jgi:hypothetical protein
MTALRPDQNSASTIKKTHRGKVHSYIFKLQSDALRALPENGKRRPGDDWPLRGKRTVGDEKKLRLVVDNIFPFLETLEHFLPAEGEGSRHEHAYCLLYFIIVAASFVGSRTGMSLSQKSFFEAIRNVERGKKSGEVRARTADEAWRTDAGTKARELRLEEPSITKEDLVDVLMAWFGARSPGEEALRRFLRAEEKVGRLPPRGKKLTYQL